MKYINMKENWKMNLQLFAGDEEGGSEGDEESEEDEENNSEEDDSGEKKFTQKDVDEAVKKRLARERRKWQRGQQSTKNNSEESEETEQEKKAREAEEKASTLELKWTCLEHNVKKECVDDVLALAKVHTTKDETLDIEDAIDKVLEKYPQFGEESKDQEGEQEEEQKKKGWGQRHGGDPSKKKTVDDVIKEKLFGK